MTIRKPKKEILTEKNKLFCKEIFKRNTGITKKSNAQIVKETFNIGANGGKTDKVQSTSTASTIANEYLKKPKIQNELQRLYAKAGLTKELISTSLVEDIKKKPQKRVRELELGSRILGMAQQTEKLEERELYDNNQYEIIAERITERIRKPIKNPLNKGL